MGHLWDRRDQRLDFQQQANPSAETDGVQGLCRDIAGNEYEFDVVGAITANGRGAMSGGDSVDDLSGTPRPHCYNALFQ
jgi:hypothetical protein